MIKPQKTDVKRFVFLNLCLVGSAFSFVLIALALRKINSSITYCLFYDLFHLYCPLCGGTRAVFSILRLDIASACMQNAFLLYLIAATVYYDVSVAIKLLSGKRDAFRVQKWMLVTTCAFCLVFFIVRNLMMIAFGIDPLGDLIGFWR